MIIMRELTFLLVHHPGNNSALISRKTSKLGVELVESEWAEYYIGDWL